MLARSILLALTLLPAGRALAQDVHDRVTLGDDVFVRAGEHVSSVVTAGGDASIGGIVDADVVTMGGDVVIEPGAVVHGGLATMGGDAVLRKGALVEGDIITMGGDLVREEGSIVRGSIVADEQMGHVEAEPIEIVATAPGSAFEDFTDDVFSGLVTFGLLFVLALLLRTFASDRFATLQAVIAKEPARAGVMGFAGLAAALSAILVLCVTIVGIPIAVALAVALPIVGYVGLAAAAAVIGAALPIPRLRDRPVAQLGAGVALLYLASLVPVANLVFIGLALVVGIGSIVVTRFDAVPPLPRVSHLGPYRSDWAL